MNESNGAPSANSQANISEHERKASLLAGGGLALAALQLCVKGRVPAGLGLLALSGALLHRGKTKHCAVYEAAGVNRAKNDAQDEISAAKPQNEKVEIVQVMTINKPAQELYDFWRRGDGLAQLSPLLESVRSVGDKRWEWVSKAPKGDGLHWETEISEDKPGSLIRWHSLGETEGQTLPAPHDGAISFRELAHDRGTEVRLEVNYNPPGSLLGAAMAKLFGAVPDQFALEMLRRFKQLTEAGEMAQAQNQPTGDKEEKS